MQFANALTQRGSKNFIDGSYFLKMIFIKVKAKRYVRRENPTKTQIIKRLFFPTFSNVPLERFLKIKTEFEELNELPKTITIPESIVAKLYKPTSVVV